MAEVPVDYSHPLVKYLWPIRATADAAQRVAATVMAYSEATGRQVDTPLSAVDQRLIRDWLLQEERAAPTNSQGHSAALLVGSYSPVGIPRIHADLASKAGWLASAPCVTCVGVSDITPLTVSFPIRTRPFTSQTRNRQGFIALKGKIREYLATRNLDLSSWKGYELCVSIVAVVPSSEKMKDVDNMVKGLLDAMQGPVYENDRLVQHLSVRRLVHDGDPSFAYYKIHLIPVLDARTDVIEQDMRVGWAGQQEIIADS
jgi:Holliday junction resolvase RusA-like endonuclease